MLWKCHQHPWQKWKICMISKITSSSYFQARLATLLISLSYSVFVYLSLNLCLFCVLIQIWSKQELPNGISDWNWSALGSSMCFSLCSSSISPEHSTIHPPKSTSRATTFSGKVLNTQNEPGDSNTTTSCLHSSSLSYWRIGVRLHGNK